MVKWVVKEFDDFILLCSDGMLIYNFVVVVDDYDMGIIYIVCGDDYLVNVVCQGQIYDVMGWDCLVFVYILFIYGDDGKKLFKCYGVFGVQDYWDMGYLLEGLCNYLLCLGWVYGDQELFIDVEVIVVFDLGGLNKVLVCMDLFKLVYINSYYIVYVDDVCLLELSWLWILGLENCIVDEDIIKVCYLCVMLVLKICVLILDEFVQ